MGIAFVVIMEDIMSWTTSWVLRPHKTKWVKTLGASEGTATQRQGRDRSYAPRPRSTYSLQNTEETRKDASLEPLEGAWPCGQFKFMHDSFKTQL